MKNRRRRLVFLLLLIALSSRIKGEIEITESKMESKMERASYSAGFEANGGENIRYIVKYNTKTRLDNIDFDTQVEGTHIMALPEENSEVMTLRTLRDVQIMEERDDVDYVEMDHKVYMLNANKNHETNNENAPWGIRMVKAMWVSPDQMANQKVCIIDSGLEARHKDLPRWQSRVNGSSNGAGPWSKDEDGHGTHVAGIIAALKNNRGVIGINRGGKLKLHIVRVFDSDGSWAWRSSLIAAVNKCVENGSRVVNMSLGGPDYSQAEEAAFANIFNSGVLLVAAGGNDGNSAYSYPAAHPSVIGVGAVDKQRQLASFSQFNDQIDLVAPGVNIRSTFPINRYRSLSGTSFAAPHVSGVAALIWSHHPDKSAKEVREALLNTAEDLGRPGRDDYFGYGLVNAKEALEYLESSCLETCTDSPVGWHDKDGVQYNCVWYGEDQNCITYGNDFENFGKTASEACCVCGGGEQTTCNNAPTQSPDRGLYTTSSPTRSPTVPPTAGPTDSPTSSPTKTPTSSPTSSPTSKPTDFYYDDDGGGDDGQYYDDEFVDDDQYYDDGFVDDQVVDDDQYYDDQVVDDVDVREDDFSDDDDACYDDPPDWHDSDGDSYNCEWYGKPGENRCKNFGHLYENFGKTAKEACCVCGGGSSCQDVEGWHDADGVDYDCVWYAQFDRCEKWGDLYENNGYTANEACCACK